MYNNIDHFFLTGEFMPDLKLFLISDLSYELTKTAPLAISPQLFHSKLKTLLYNKTYPNNSSSSPCLNFKHHPP